MLGLNLEVLPIGPLFVGYTLIDGHTSVLRSSNVAIVRDGSAATIRVVSIVKFVRVDEVALILVLSVGLHKLSGERAIDRLIVSRVAALLHVG